MVKRRTVEQFMDRGGYEILKRKQTKTGKFYWKNMEQAIKTTGLTKPTILSVLKKFPTKDLAEGKGEQKYYKELEESKGWKEHVLVAKTRKGKPYIYQEWFSDFKKVVAEAFSYLGNIDPLGWDSSHYTKLWKRKEWYDKEIQNIRVGIGLELRRLMFAIKRQRHLLDDFKTTQPPPKEKFPLNEDQIMILIEQIPNIRTLLFFVIGVLCGARRSALRNPKRPERSLKPLSIDVEESSIKMFEEKVDKYVTRYFPKELISLLLRFITDFKLKPKDLFFPLHVTSYTNQLKTVTKNADGIRRPMKSHVLMKHTFIYQCALHGVPDGVAVAQSGTELRTLQKWYGLVQREAQRKHMQGEKWEPEPFIDFARRVVTKAEERYNFLIRTKKED